MKKLKIWFKNIFKTEPRIIEQKIYVVFYQEMCPICKEVVGSSQRFSKEEGRKEPFLDNILLMECPKCHLAVYGKRIKIEKVLKKYIEDDIEGLKLISEETIC